MEVGGWVQVSLGFFLVENQPKTALNQYRHFGVIKNDTVCPPYNAVVRVHDVIARYK